jgi:hypothetical protein
MCTLPNAAVQCCCGQHRATVLGPMVPAETAPTQCDLQCIADHGCMGWRKASRYTNTLLSRGRSLNTALCRADGPFDCRLKTKFGPDVGKFLRVHVAPFQDEKAERRKASFAPQCITGRRGARTPASSAILASRRRLIVAKISK